MRGEWPVDEVDVVVVDLVLEHVEHLRPVFVQAKNKLAAGGMLFICALIV
jgi:2-polyprenyl-3-methyl-5-hydroxy-6-metoxy-1,4-benzoquinol methylase